ncbi:MAG: hypothetical protein J5948_06325 [Bacteroidales bacterium]|nr:hypothetical protein [Bacteroidales bacterium]
MKESYSLCFTSHDEVMFRDEEDHGMFVNVMAVEGFRTGTEIMSDAEMSNHVHINAFTDCPAVFAGRTRMAYTKYVNRKYGRNGRFGEKGTYILKVDGFNHQLVLSNYILRNGLHHGAAASAFGYPFCSVGEMFSKDLGTALEPAVFTRRAEIAGFLPRYADFPDTYVMDKNGIFLRSSFMEIRRTEQFYTSPRNFLYQMNRLTDETWIQDQLQDRTGKPITLADIEHGLDEKSIAELLNNEHGRNFNHSRMQDLDVCKLIDHELLPRHGSTSVYRAVDTQKRRIYGILRHDYHIPDIQIRRCLVWDGNGI